MLDAFEIITTSGIVLWRKHYIPLQSSVINNFIRDVFIEMREDSAGRTESNTPSTYKKDSYTFTYTTAKTAKGVRLIFVAVDQSLRPLSWANDLATAVSGVFTNRYTSKLDKPVAKINTSDFDQTFEALVRKFGQGSTRRRQSETDQESLVELTPPSSSASATDENEQPPPPPVPQFKSAATRNAIVDDTTSADITPVATPDTSRPTTPLHPPSHLLAAKAGPGKQSRRARKAANAFNSSAPVSSGDDSDRRPKSSKSNAKSKRRWGADGMMIDGDDDQVLDYSETATPNLEEERPPDVDQVNTEQMGSRTKQGLFVLRDLEDEVDAILAQSKQRQAAAKVEELGPGLLGSTSNKITGFFKNLVGGTTMSKEDLKQPLHEMREHLIKKNVALEAADRLCKIVEADLLNQQTASFTSIDKTINESMTKALTRILTPSTSLDLLRDINKTIEEPNPRPYIISIVGVNGVGKSTNLSKLAYFLLQNKFRILIAACDTFRSGAVEQLRVHVRNLEQLSKRENAGHIELFEKGYGKDAAEVAKQAIDFATNAGKGSRLFDVVLIDTAGRRHNDKRLMSSLTKFGRLANPDKIFMVGEALVGTDSIAQARHFAEQFVDAKGAKRHGGMGMDGFIISKCDAVGDMVGTLVSMVHATDIPVVFLGVGQHYGDLRGLNVEWAVSKLMK